MFERLLKSNLLRKLSILVGALAIILMLWYFALLYEINLWWGMLILAILISGITLFFVLKWRRNHQRGQQLERELMDGAISSEQDIAELRKKLKNAIKSLKTSVLGVSYKGSAALYALPWYMVIGPSAAGKTSLLRNSGLNFPLASAEDIQMTGFGGTRNCDWWFSDQAILLDTAGRYTTDVNDKEEWLGFLKVLKKYRKKLPINGVIVTLGLSEILTVEQKNLQWHVHLIRERIEELTVNLGFIVPVTIILTKCDLLRGFDQFFQQFSAQERQQVWGVSLEVMTVSEKIIEQFNDRLENLYCQLSQLRLEFLQTHQSLDKKHYLYQFPIQFSQASKRVKQFIELIVKENPYHNKFNLRGVYFTSSCQEGSSIEYLADNDEYKFIKNKYGAVIGNTPYFIKNLLSNVVFSKEQSIHRNKKLLFFSKLSRSFYVGLIFLVVATLILMWTFIYSRDVQQYQDTVSAANNLSLSYHNVASESELTMAQVNLYEHYNEILNHSNNYPWYQRLGLFSGEQLTNSLEYLLNKTLARNFLPLVINTIQTKLQSYANSWPKLTPDQKNVEYNDYYQTLRDYRLLAVRAEGDTWVDAQSIAKIWLSISPQNNTLNEEKLMGLVNYYLHSSKFPEGAIWQPNPALIQQAQAQLHRAQNIAAIYQTVRQNLILQTKTLKVSDLYDGAGSELFYDDYALSKIFTKQGWENTVESALEKAAMNASRGDWVLDTTVSVTSFNGTKPAIEMPAPNPAVAKQLLRQLQQQYFSDYVQSWNSWLQAFQIRPFVSLIDAENGLETLTRLNNPLSHLLDAIAENFTIDIAGDSTNELQNIYRILINPINHHEYISAIKKVANDIDALNNSGDISNAAKDLATHLLLNNSSSQLAIARNKITQLLTPLQSSALYNGVDYMLTSPLRAVWRVILLQAADGIEQQWRQKIVPAYAGGLATHYPFSTAGSDADYSNVQQFFDLQQGTFWKFINDQLGVFLKLEGAHWSPNTWLSVGMPFTKEFMASLQQAQQMSMLIFSNNGKFSYSLYPIPQPTLSQIRLSSNGSVYSYRNGPQIWTNKFWSIQDKHPFSQLLIERNDREAQASVDGDGIWGLFKVFRQAKISKQKEGYLLTWNLTFSDGRHQSLSLLFKTNSSASAIEAFVLEPLVLPEEIIQKEN